MTALYEQYAELYDLAFDWDVAGEAAWLHERLGSGCGSVLEPGCGSGRMLEALGRRGLHVVGLDGSLQMVEAARRRLARAGIQAAVVLADMSDFSLGRAFGGAICPINTLLHLSPAGLARHLDRMAEHLRPGARYIAQVGLYDGPEQLH